MSKGKIIQIKDYHIQLPDVPDDKSQVLFVDELKRNQYWRRQEFPKHFFDFDPRPNRTKAFASETFYNTNGELMALSEPDSLIVQRYLQEENRRRRYGVWMMINGELQWCSPDYYYNLQWCQMKDLPEKYGRYRRVQNEFLTVYHWAKFQDWITAIIEAKCKKSGVTQIMSGAFLNEGTYQEGFELLIASKEFPHAVDVAMAYLFHSFDNLPMIMQPRVSKRNLHEIKFGKPVGGLNGNSNSKTPGKALNTRISAQKTKPTAFDGPVVKRGWVDEFPKLWEASKVSPDLAYKKMIETVKLQQRKNGLLVFTSYMPEVDDRGFYEFRDLYYNSKITKRDATTGQTPTGAIAMSMTALEANEDCFDIYGECDQNKAYILVTAENNSKKTPSDKQAHRRQYPTCENDMFDSGGRGTTFDNLRLAVRFREVEMIINTGIMPYNIGHLRWTNSLWEEGNDTRRPTGKFGTVYMQEFTDEERLAGLQGSIKTFQDLPAEFLNVPFKNNNTNDEGLLLPEEFGLCVGSFDPTDYVLKKDVVEFSQNASHGGFVPDPILETKGIRTDETLWEYHFRHDNPDDTLEDCVKIILYFGCRMIIEANKKWLVTALKKEGLQYFLLLKQKDGSIRPYQDGDENTLVNTTQEMINAYCRALNRYFAKPKSAADKDMLSTEKSLACLQQHMDFDPTNTKKFDLVVSKGYWRLGVESFMIYIDELKGKNNYDGDAMEVAMNGLILG